MTSVTSLVCDVCGRTAGPTATWLHIEERGHSIERPGVLLNCGSWDICGPDCLTVWIAKEREKRQHYSAERRWIPGERPHDWR